MAKLTVYDARDLKPLTDGAVTSVPHIQAIVSALGGRYERLPADVADDASDATLIDHYAHHAVEAVGLDKYRGADVLRVGAATADVRALRDSFLREHLHDDDEIRFFVSGAGTFYVNAGARIIAIECRCGDLLLVPAGARHWFDAGEHPEFVAVRLFTETNSWVAAYTGSGVAERFHGVHAAAGAA